MNHKERLEEMEKWKIDYHEYECIDYLINRVKVLTIALEYYANPKHKSDLEIGQTDEFGCGCCAGIIVDESILFPHMNYEPGTKGLDYDSDVQGEVARKALEKE